MKQLSRWPWLMVLALLTLGLGWQGFSLLPEDIRPSPEDRLIRTLKFFKAEGSLPTGSPAILRVARLTGALFTVLAFVQVWRRFFQDQIALFHLSHWRAHAVVCGLGRKGLHLVESLRQRRQRVAVATLVADEDDFATCRRLGAIPIAGDATKSTTLDRIRIEHASEVFAVCGDDRTNFEVALQLVDRYRAAQCTHAVRCVVHLVDLPLLHQLQHRDFFRDCPPGVSLTFFNSHEHAARRLMADVPLPVRTSTRDAAVHLIVAGSGPALRAIVLHHARTAHLGDLRAPRITILSPALESERTLLLGAFPALPMVADLDWREWMPSRRNAGFLTDLLTGDTHLRIVIALPTDEASLSAALMFRESGLDRSVPILMRTGEQAGLTRLLSESNRETTQLNLVPFGAIGQTCGPEVWEHPDLDRLAESFHESYRRSQITAGAMEAELPGLRPWQNLPEDLRAANRVLADHLVVKHQTLAALTPPGGSAPPSGEVLETLARMEHNRWSAERRLAGWQPGPARDNLRRFHPSLIPWESLSESERQKDRDTVLTALQTQPIGGRR